MICWLTAIVVNSIFTDTRGQMRGVIVSTIRFANWVIRWKGSKIRMLPVNSLWNSSFWKRFFLVRVSADLIPTCNFAQRVYVICRRKARNIRQETVETAMFFEITRKLLCVCARARVCVCVCVFMTFYVIQIYIFETCMYNNQSVSAVNT